MFGLMRAKKCGMSEGEKHFRRLNYCGTCKTAGALYGQKSRLLLNHDTVFLAEILSAVSSERVENWQKSYQSFNCLSLPQNEMPKSLQFAATTNIILTEFKLADHIADEKKRRYKFARKSFSGEFQKAEKLLNEWKFPLRKVKTILEKQTSVENESRGKNAGEILENFAAPTAETTAIFFSEGAKICGADELEKSFYRLGFDFGKLIYLLDAFEDYEKDFRARQFNAIRAAFDLSENKIATETKRKVVAILKNLESEISGEILKLPVEEKQKTIFISRLSQNLNRKLKTNLPVVQAKKVCVPKPKTSFKQRWQNASMKAQNLAGKYSWQMPVVFLFVFVFAIVAPAQTREAKSARECFDLGFNLMFLGAIFGSVLAFPKPFLQKFGGRKKKVPQQGGEDSGDSSWCDWCDCDCCDCCDCCSSGEDAGGCCGCGCDSCGCDSCDCSCD